MVEQATQFISAYVLILFRIAGMMMFAPLLGSSRIPKRVKALMACVLAAAMAPSLSFHVRLPPSEWDLCIAIGGEMMFGLAMGLILGLIFVATQWAGEIIGTQMGLNLGQTFDPQFGSQGSVIADLYYFMTLIVFLQIDGQRAMIKGVHDSFSVLPLFSVGVNQSLFAMLMGLLGGATTLAMQLASPILVAMLVVDVVLGFIGKTVPQLNIMTAGISLRSMVGLIVIIVGLSLTNVVIREALLRAMKTVYTTYALQT